MNLSPLSSLDVSGKNVVVRVGFDVPLTDDGIGESFRITAAQPTIEDLLHRGARTVSLLTHLGRPDGKRDAAFSLDRICNNVSSLLGRPVQFIDDCVGLTVASALNNAHAQDVFLLENVRFYAGEEKNDPAFAAQIAENFDCVVMDAFSVAHRAHASIATLPRLRPSAVGIQCAQEVAALDHALTAIEHPAVAIIGGAKIETKLPMITVFQKLYDAVLVGGKIALEARDKGLTFPDNVFIAEDFVQDGKDIGPQSIALFIKKIATAKTIVWNGPMGKFEDPLCRNGNDSIARAIATSGAYSVAGGGESVQALDIAGVRDKISFVSTGGGAMLAYLAGEALPGIESVSGVKAELDRIYA